MEIYKVELPEITKEMCCNLIFQTKRFKFLLEGNFELDFIERFVNRHIFMSFIQQKQIAFLNEKQIKYTTGVILKKYKLNFAANKIYRKFAVNAAGSTN